MQPASVIKPLWQADYGKFFRPLMVTCCCFLSSGDLASGDSNGTIYIWGRRSNRICAFRKHAHEKAISCFAQSGRILFSAAFQDEKVHAWLLENDLDSLGKLDVPREHGNIRCMIVRSSSLVLATSLGSIFVCPLKTGKLARPLSACVAECSTNLTANDLLESPFVDQVLSGDILTQGHISDGIGCLRFQPQLKRLTTVSSDGQICQFDLERCTGLRKAKLVSLSFHPQRQPIFIQFCPNHIQMTAEFCHWTLNCSINISNEMQ
ncbi:Echinoderm microtubule associated protein like [Cichlidogyrus casuarinus]|uniref:Echinoderm microtubule associated protein like n=1 Tax=Cichlidogyrus casuarinus TaxID=1844966 RepID=A0ABD2PWX7_9PLAT